MDDNGIMRKLLVFDMDGTLYDMGDVMYGVYDLQVSFLMDRMGWTKSKAIQFLGENGVELYVTRNSKSALGLFVQMGFERKEWTDYKQMRFPVEKIDPAKAAKPCLLERFARLGDAVLLTSNTTQLCRRILARIGLAENAFRKIVCSDTADVGTPFDKYLEVGKLMAAGAYGSVLSIGDRYLTDIVPVLKIGGSGCLVRGCCSLEKVCRDLECGHLSSCPEYEYYAKE